MAAKVTVRYEGPSHLYDFRDGMPPLRPGDRKEVTAREAASLCALEHDRFTVVVPQALRTGPKRRRSLGQE